MPLEPHWENTDAGRAAKAAAEAADPAGAAVADKMAPALAQGFVGRAVDPVPNEAYTAPQPTAAEPMPEVDPAGAAGQ